MSDVREIPAVLEAAERAASSGDLASAETLLHEVVRLQEATVGPGHADLASTYNNLAVVCEMAGRPTDAEQFYRRAYRIASSALDPQDPLVTTSFNNLKEFCQARGVPLEVAAKAPVEPLAPAVVLPAGPALVSPPEAPRTPEAAPSPREEAPATVGVPGAVGPAASTAPLRRIASSGTVIVGVIAAAAVVAVLAVAWPSRETPEADTPAAHTARVRFANACCAPRTGSGRGSPSRGGSTAGASGRGPRRTSAACVCRPGITSDGHAGARRPALSEPVDPRRRVALRRALQPRGSRAALVLHARRGIRGCPRAPSLVPRRLPRAGCRPHGSRESRRRLPHLQPSDCQCVWRRRLARRSQDSRRRATAGRAIRRSMTPPVRAYGLACRTM